MSGFGIRALVVAGLLIAIGSPVQAGVIMLYTQDSWEGGNPTPPAGLPDDAFINWAQTQLGHTVIKKTTAAILDPAVVQADATAAGASLIIFGPRNGSANYTNKGLNTAVNVPILSLIPHAIRTDRLDWVGAGTGADNTAWTSYKWLTADPRTNGIGTQVFTYPTGVGDTRWSVATYDTTTLAVTTGGAGKALGAKGDSLTNAEFMEWKKGDLLDGAQVAADRRVFFGGPNWAKYTASYQVSFDNYNADGKHLLARIVNDLIAGKITTVTADAGAAYTIKPGELVMLDASGSSKSGAGAINSYAWDLDGDNDFNDATGAKPSLSYDFLRTTLGLAPGAHSISLKVGTNDYEVGTASGTLNVAPVPEPSTVILLATGLAALLVWRRGK
jgi:hypothetical protein